MESLVLRELTDLGAGTPGVRHLEGRAGIVILTSVADAPSLVETALNHGVSAVLLFRSNLSAAFFDLSSTEAGHILQKLRQYRIRLAVVAEPAEFESSRRFADALAEERRSGYFDVLPTAKAARAWLSGPDDVSGPRESGSSPGTIQAGSSRVRGERGGYP